MALTTRVWSAGKLLLLAGALLLTYGLFAAASMRVALKLREVEVPPLTGKTVNDASTILADYGLSLKVEEGRRVDAKVPAGQRRSRIVTQLLQRLNTFAESRGLGLAFPSLRCTFAGRSPLRPRIARVA